MQNLMLNRLAPVSNTKNEKLKSLYTNVYFSVKQIFSSIYAFKGEIYDKLKYLSREASINIEKVFLNRLHSSTFVYTHIVTRLH